MKRLSILLLIAFLINNMTTIVFANSSDSNLNIKILYPESVKDYPGREELVKVSITNNGKTDLNEVLAYITMADVGKNMTVNLEDYNADKPVYIEGIKAGETKNIELPIRFVYTSKYQLYVTVVLKGEDVISSSNSIPIDILGNTKINKVFAINVAMMEPLLLLGFVWGVYRLRKRKYKVN